MEIINDQYWIEYAKKSVEESITVINTAADKLQKLTLWFWTTYTTAIALGTITSVIDASGWVMLLISAPVLTLILTYWLCDWVQAPVAVSYDPRIPYEIRTAYTEINTTKRKRYNAALLGTAVSAVFLAAALFLYNISGKKSSYNMDVSFNKDMKVVAVSGVYPAKQEIITEVHSIKNDGKNSGTVTSVSKAKDDGMLNLLIKPDTTAAKFVVKTYWTEDGLTKWLVKSVDK